MTSKIEGTEELIGRKLKDDVIEKSRNLLDSAHYFVTRPDFYSDNMHINMNVYVSDDYRITEITGNKCQSYYSGLYNRSAKVHDRAFTKKDISWLKKYIKSITEDK